MALIWGIKMANKVKIQTYLSEDSHKRVVKFQETFKKMGVTISDSEAVNSLIELLCANEGESSSEQWGFSND